MSGSGFDGWFRDRGVAVLIALILSLTLAPVTTLADCCVCRGCPTGGSQCQSSGSGCDFDPFFCGLACSSSGCASSFFSHDSCGAFLECHVPAPTMGGMMQLALMLILLSAGIYYLRRRDFRPATRAALLTLTVLCSAAALHAAFQLHIAGVWQPSGMPDGSVNNPQAPTWTADLTHADDGSLTGTLTVTGSELISTGRVQGQVSGHDVAGIILDDTNHQVATFTGTIEGSMLHGQYSAGGGATGTFTWNIDS